MQCIVAIGFDKTNREYVYMYLCIYVCGPSKRIVSISYIFSLCYDPPLKIMAISPICKNLPWSFQSTQVKENLEVLLILIKDKRDMEGQEGHGSQLFLDQPGGAPAPQASGG